MIRVSTRNGVVAAVTHRQLDVSGPQFEIVNVIRPGTKLGRPGSGGIIAVPDPLAEVFNSFNKLQFSNDFNK